MKIAIVGGTGDLGFGLALRLSKHYNIIIGSRKEEKAKKAAEEVKKLVKDAKVEGKGNIEAVKEADVIILSVPYEYVLSTLKDLKEYLKNKIVVSVVVPLSTVIGDSPEKPLFPYDGSVAEMIQNYLKDSKVVGAFQNISYKSLRDLDNKVDADVLVCGDDEEAKKIVIEIANKIDGVRGIDAGKLEMSRIVEGLTPLLIGINKRYKSECSIKISNLKI
ncbi:NADPH-dependent F420 reductase [Methanocaldococcus indicus]|uniref:NADPH-dependent F420 reductase n=1 Tax=Methanocaldococcus indicus TaxID=213231 RepID=UPI003C6D7802